MAPNRKVWGRKSISGSSWSLSLIHISKDEGGRHTPFFNNYRPQFYFRTTDVTGIITLPEGTEMCMPGDNVMMHVELLTPVAMEEGLRFADVYKRQDHGCCQQHW